MAASPIDMNPSEDSPTLDPLWLAEHQNRLLGFEILDRTLHARYQPMEPEELSDKIGAHKGLAHSITKKLRDQFNANGRPG